jgi:hypothetical protein
MALQNQSGVYCRITNVDIERSRVFIEKYHNADVRSQPTEFDLMIPDSVHCATLPTHLAAPPTAPTIQDAVITAGYLALKDEPPFNNAGTEQWADC